ncbi:hypothetical protein [Vallitalea okinawensis]|uniref:hypothetical protein n=1 Tax=Vallitalea okinawensis TaxID=2078660 RepID=UPI000CFD55F3|nr:hypothetical protein [Vallitalea okinawensis]
MPKTLQDRIRRTINKSKEEGTKKQISLVLDERTLQMTDVIVEQFKVLTGGKIATSRNQLIEDAIEEYIKAASEVLLQDHYINIDELIDSKSKDEDKSDNEQQLGRQEGEEEKNLAIFPARNEGFERVFLGKKQWYSVRIAEKRIPYIEYVACYRGAPYSGITHYAKVKSIKPIHGTNKYIIHFDGEPIELSNLVSLGSSDVMEVRKLRYSNLELLKKANEVSDLW